MDLPTRLRAIQSMFGGMLPADYFAFLAGHAEDPAEPGRIVSTNPDYLGVQSLFEIGNGPEYLQADWMLNLLGDVLPPGMTPVGGDICNNLYLVDCRTGPSHGAVFWWNHERDVGDHRVELVALSFTAFLASLVPQEDD